MDRMYKVWRNGKKQKMLYSNICYSIGFAPEVRFVKITTAGTISFYCGKPHEVKALYQAVNRYGYKPSCSLTYAAKH